MVESSRVRARATADVLFAAQMRFGVRPAPPARQDSAASYYEPLLRDDLGASPPDEGEDAGSMYATPAMKHRMYMPGTKSAPIPGVPKEPHSGTAVTFATPPKRVSARGWPPMPAVRLYAFSVGHVLNDMTAACWFSYLLIYLTQVRGLDQSMAGVVMFCGQAADAISTPLVGIFSDKSTGCPGIGLGRRKMWNAGGVLLVAVSFLFVFVWCVPCLVAGGGGPSTESVVAGYAVAASVFNVGWAAVQVSHMALMPELSPRDDERTVLNSWRYGFTILSNVVVFGIFFGLVNYIGVAGTFGADGDKFQFLGLATVGIGLTCSAIFLLFTREMSPADRLAMFEEYTHGHASLKDVAHEDAIAAGPTDTAPLLAPAGGAHAGDRSVSGDRGALGASAVDTAKHARGAILWRDWFAIPAFYLVGLVYMFSRLAANVSQTYIPFFVVTTLKMDKQAIAIVPLLVYLSSLASTMCMRRANERVGRRATFLIGAGLVVVSSVWLAFLHEESSGWIYAAAILNGAGSSTIMVTSVAMEADLIGKNIGSGAFVYGALSFTDKLSNGAFILLVQVWRNSIAPESKQDSEFVRYVTAVAPAIAALCAAIIAFFVRVRAIKRRMPSTATTGAAAAAVAGAGGGGAPGAARPPVEVERILLRNMSADPAPRPRAVSAGLAQAAAAV